MSGDWRPIETAPKMRTILLFAVTDRRDDGTVANWRMETGSWHTGFEDERSKQHGYTPWTWGGHQLKVYEVQPTHWMPLPRPPTEATIADPSEYIPSHIRTSRGGLVLEDDKP